MKRHNENCQSSTVTFADVFIIDELMNSVLVNHKISINSIVYLHSINKYWRARYSIISRKNDKHLLYMGEIFRQIKDNVNEEEGLEDVSPWGNILTTYRDCHYDYVNSLETLNFLIFSCELIERFCDKLYGERYVSLRDFILDSSFDRVQRLLIGCGGSGYEARLLALKSTFLESFLDSYGYKVMIPNNNFYGAEEWSGDDDTDIPYVGCLSFCLMPLSEAKEHFKEFFHKKVGSTIAMGLSSNFGFFYRTLYPDIDNLPSELGLIIIPKMTEKEIFIEGTVEKI